MSLHGRAISAVFAGESNRTSFLPSSVSARMENTIPHEACNSRISYDLWKIMQEEARIQKDEILVGLLGSIVLNCDTLCQGIARLLSLKLENTHINAEILEELFRSFFVSNPQVVERVAADIFYIYRCDPSVDEHLTPFLFFKGFQAVQTHRIAHWLWANGRKSLARYLQERAASCFAVDIHPAARIGQRVMFDHGTGIVVGETAVIEDDVILLHNVTLGSSGKESGDRHPKVRRGALIGAGANILGNIEIGEGAKVGAGAVVLHNVPPFTTVVGNPARIVGTRHVDFLLPALGQNPSSSNYMAKENAI